MPAEEPTSAEAPYDGRWWRRLRRAFEIPDLVDDAAARKVIVHEVAQQTESGNFDRMVLAGNIVTAFLTMGEDGDLDEMFFGEAHQALFENPNVLSIDERNKRLATDAADPFCGPARVFAKKQ